MGKGDRYRKMVWEKAERVQYNYITKKKKEMEMGRTLMGVTMHEAGV